MKALREAKAIYARLTGKGCGRVGYDDLVLAFAALVEEIEAAPVGEVEEEMSGLVVYVTGSHLKGQRVRVVAVGGE